MKHISNYLNKNDAVVKAYIDKYGAKEILDAIDILVGYDYSDEMKDYESYDDDAPEKKAHIYNHIRTLEVFLQTIGYNQTQTNEK